MLGSSCSTLLKRSPRLVFCDFPSMGIPDGLRGTRSVTYMRKQKEKSLRGLLKLFNWACDATGRPRYEDLWPPLPLRGAASAPSSPTALENLESPPAMAQSSNFPEAAPAIVSPPPGLGWDVEERSGDATDALTRRSPQLDAVIPELWRGYASRLATASLSIVPIRAAALKRKRAACKLQRWWRAVCPRVIRMGLLQAATEGSTKKMILIQAAWREHRRRRAEEFLEFAGAEFIPSRDF